MNTKFRNPIILAVVLLLLSACGSGPSGPGMKPADSKAKTNGLALYAQQDYFSAAQWLQQAWDSNNNDAAVFAALLDTWKQLGEMPQLWKLLSESNLRTPAVNVIEAELLQEAGDCAQALIKSDELVSPPVDEAWQQRYWQLKANCLQSEQFHLQAVVALVQLKQTANDELMSQVWRNEIVNNLIRIDEAELIMAIGDDSYDYETQGWFEAAYVNFGADGVSGEDWLMLWAEHPAAQYFLDMNQVNKQQSVAVLLPLSGRFQAAAKAIQKGLLIASVVDEANQFDLQFFDTGSQAENISAAWYAAQEQEVDLIIGPLDKAAIDKVEEMPAPAIPVVLLNQSESDYFQFTLSPEVEAEQAAERMYEDGQRRAIILAPNDPWGERMTKAFAQRFVDLGGQIIDNTYFQPEQNDYSAQLRQTLGLIESQLRAKNLQSFLKLNLISEEVVRADMDAIFLAARPDFARLMVPQLKFHRANETPVYATSHVFDGINNEQHNRDLQGVKFAISPIELPNSQWHEILPFELSRVGNSKNLFALGYDAYQLITRLQWMSRVNSGMIEGLTGKINLGFDGQFRRGLKWAEYNNGSIVALP